ncbi:MAG: membrane protein insertion efficiency factor YidD [Acidimicrobiia bacterium]|nr:membrane protein insertion efficiency factor YidD [Acidimicrobiia bacterium]
MSPLARLLDGCIAGYQRIRGGRPSPCRHIPSCSVYGREAMQHHGAVKGSWYTVTRILRCNPWGTHGYDPVPGTANDPERRGDAPDAPCGLTAQSPHSPITPVR